MPARSRKSARKSARKKPAVKLPPATDWRTSDEDEILRRVARAREEKHSITNLAPEHPVFSNFRVASPSGMVYQTEIRDLATRAFACTCPDFRSNGLGTCKHIEATLIWLKRRCKGEMKLAATSGSRRIDLVPADGGLRIERNLAALPASLRGHFDASGALVSDPAVVVAKAGRCAWFRVSQEVPPFLEGLRRAEDRRRSRRDYETGVVEGRHPEHVTLHPLYPYQREGMLHLAFTERALLADEMGLGKTIQAIAACALLHHLGKANRVLVVTPASLKAEWEEQIRRFTTLPLRLVYGPRSVRAAHYADPAPPFFTIVNYEQVVTDTLDINARLKPDIVVLDEAQRIKNWATKTARAIKRLTSRYAFVLTGTPIENRIDELYSIVDFLDPVLLGPLFRFNREYYQLDDKGRPEDYQNLVNLRRKVAPVMLRRRKREVETELPDRTDRNHFVRLTPAMRADYDETKRQVSQILNQAARRPLTRKEQDLLMILLAMMRMMCDSPSIIKRHDCQDCPKLGELSRILDECLDDPDVKVIIFSEWEGMLRRVRDLAEKRGIGYAWHTGSVAQQRRRAEIITFRENPDCRLFLSTDSGGLGLNLQNASVVINCDLPWNPARLEQRIARAWRKHQLRAVTVINLVAEDTIEHNMLDTLAVKSNLAAGVLDGSDQALEKTRLKRGTEAHLARLQQLLSTGAGGRQPATAPAPQGDPPAAFAARAAQALGDALLHCEEAVIANRETPMLIVALRHLDRAGVIHALHQSTDWRGARPDLTVLDEATWNNLRALAAAGLVTLNTRATRTLVGEPSTPPPPALTPEQLARIASLRDFASRKQRAAGLLEEAGLPEEAVAQREAADKALAAAQAIEDHQPEAVP